MKIYILAFDGLFDTGLSTVLDAFTTANDLAEMSGIASLRLETTVVGVRKQVKTFQGLKVPAISASELETPDWVIVPALGCKMPELLLNTLSRADISDGVTALQHWVKNGAAVAAACTSTFILAESSLLNGLDATTSWWLAPVFRQRYPKINLDESRIIIKSKQIVTAGAALSHLDMALWLIRQSSPELANMAAKYLIVDSRPSQSAYIIPNHLAHADPIIERFERWARERLAEGFSLDEAAAATATSKRTLARKMKDVLGKSPLAYFQDLRVERAVHLLETTSLSVEQIAAAVGYAEGVTLRTLLRRQLGCGVRELRKNTMNL